MSNGNCVQRIPTDTLIERLMDIILRNEKDGNTYISFAKWKSFASKLVEREILKVKEKCDFCDDCELGDEGCVFFMKNYVAHFLSRFINQMMDSGVISCFFYQDGRVQLIPALDSKMDIPDDLNIASAETFRAEQFIASQIVKRSNRRFGIDDEALTAAITDFSAEKLFTITKKQEETIRNALSFGFNIIDGGPGTGKTTIVSILTNYYHRIYPRKVYCAAPTGRAAKRMSDVIGGPASTIHRLLGSFFDEEESIIGYYFNQENPIPGRVFIVDEASMMDTNIFEALMRAIPQDAILILVGDSNQLPSVGAGKILEDLISSSIVNVFSLDENFRQSKNSLILENARRVLRGESMIFDQERSDSSCQLISMELPEEMEIAVVALLRRLEKENIMFTWQNVAILCPQKSGVARVDHLNKLLQKEFKVPSQCDPLEYNGAYFQEHDRVIQTKNNYQLIYKEYSGRTGKGVFNGDLGTVSAVGYRSGGSISVHFDDGHDVIYDWNSLSGLELGFAMTVHKSQGGEFDDVILVLPKGSSLIYHRNVLYTAITRARKRLFVIGSEDTIERMAKRKVVHKRCTALPALLQTFRERMAEKR
ncbi:MAG TPA: AAA family ATPase [Bacillota bacterium]|nr:AAA family ATPase [Bacillota bacterium]HPE38454.1 AAA family ATPase [Bacillota bacterium]